MLLLAALQGLSCLWLIRPRHDFATERPPAAPQYELEQNWAALPWRKDSADETPVASLRDGQAGSPVDVFFIHPTTFFRRTWNAPVEHPYTNMLTDRYTLRMQASAYNCCGRIFAPRYRQATLYAFLDSEDNGERALGLAYSDLRRAFLYYQKHWNQGRGIVIASHSQGSHHAARLLREFFDRPDEARKLVVAYAVGFAVGRDTFRHLRGCTHAEQLGCIVSYRTVAIDYELQRLRVEPPGPAICTNPLSWQADLAWAGPQLHQGGVPEAFNRVDGGFARARCRADGLLEIAEPSLEGYAPERGGDYHIRDYGLFYVNLRENLRRRVRSFGARR